MVVQRGPAGVAVGGVDNLAAGIAAMATSLKSNRLTR